MEKDLLKNFYLSEHTREAVRSFLLQTLNEQVLESTYESGDVTGYREAKEVIDGMFIKLKTMYAQKESTNKENKAR